MSSRNYETQILDSIQMIVDDAISKADFDRTIKAVISEATDAAEGKYVATYQGNSMIVYSSNPDTRYTKGMEVYILIPRNDTTQRKTIVGAVENLGLDYISIAEGDAGYEVIGSNLANSTRTFDLCSYNKEEVKVLYSRDDDINLINFDTKGFETYAKNGNYLICGASFQTTLPLDQQIQGIYGIAFEIDYQNGEDIVPKTYIVDVDDMIGTPYNLANPTRQYAIFKIDNTNIVSVKQIYVFEHGFPNELENQPKDIFISQIEMKAANALSNEELSSTILTFNTQKGTYFDKTHLEEDILPIEAQIKIKGRILGDGADVKYYWFRENNRVSASHHLYNRLGGAGWECLNNFNSYQNDTDNVEWVPGSSVFTTSKKNNAARENKYKCVAIYNKNIILQKEFNIINYDSQYVINIISDEGSIFYYDNGKPSLTCYINEKEQTGEEYLYIWSLVDNNNKFESLIETNEYNIEYNSIFAEREQLLRDIAAETALTGAAQGRLNECNEILKKYEDITRIEKNKIFNIDLKKITYFTTYKCSVFKSETFIGTTSITIVNDITSNLTYNLVINNGDQIFKYNEAGIAPNNSSLVNPMPVLPLDFTLYDKDGKEVKQSLIDPKNIFWTIPLQHTLIEEPTEYKIYKTTDDYIELYDTRELRFDIHHTFKTTHENNVINLKIRYNGHTITAATNFTFIKTGEVGTNGTDYICKLLPNLATDTEKVNYPIVIYNEETGEYTLNYRKSDTNAWFKMQLWKNGELLFNGSQSGYSEEGQPITLTWSILQNKYSNKIKDESNLIIDSQTGEITFDTTKYEHPANIVKCQVKYNDIEHFALIPVITVRVLNNNYKIDLENLSGFQEVMYTANGMNPVYNDVRPFELIIQEKIEDIWEDVSILEKDYSVDYDWSVKGQVYYKYWQSERNLIEKTLYVSREKRNQKTFEPIETYNGLCVTNAVECSISRGGHNLGSIHIPIHLYLNRYGNASINGWDGNSVSIDENNSGMILAPQVGAGTKNDDNSFTGIFMGSVKEQGAAKEEHGLFGYNAGQRTISLNAEDGSARFGATGKGQIVIDPSTGNALIESGNFNTEAGTGMRIDLSEPSIEFGSGNFKVDKYGRMYATGFSTIDYVDKKKDEIINEVEGMLDQSPLKVYLSTENIFIPCSDENIPIYEATYNVDFSGTFGGTEIELGLIDVLYKGEGFPQTVNNITIGLVDAEQRLTFGVQNRGLVDNVKIPTNSSYTFDFAYYNKDEDMVYNISKTVTVTVLPPGEPGKSAYDIWLDNGNTGTEQDYLDSLKGADGSAGTFETERQFSGTGTQQLINSGNHEIPLLYIDGVAKQEKEYSTNVLKGFNEPVTNKDYWSYSAPTATGCTWSFENLEDGWGKIVLDCSNRTTSGYVEQVVSIHDKNINYQPGEDYTYAVEIRNSSIPNSTDSFCALGGENGRYHIFGNKNPFRLSSAQVNTGGTFVKTGTINENNTNSFCFGIKASMGSISTIELRISLVKGLVSAEDFIYEPYTFTKPTIDNPSPIQIVGIKNMFDDEDWFNTYSQINSSRIQKITFENKPAYKFSANGMTSYQYMLGKFKENTQYRFHYLGCQESGLAATANFTIVYTDGTVSTSPVPATSTLTKKIITSTANKTISYIRLGFADGKGESNVIVAEMMLYEGNFVRDYIPANKWGLDITINNKNMINIFDLIPYKLLASATGEPIDASGSVISPFIKLENVSYITMPTEYSYALYYDKNYNYLGSGENLYKGESSIENTNGGKVPYHLNSSIYYVRFSYQYAYGTGPAVYLETALAQYKFNDSHFITIGETSLTEDLKTSISNNKYLTTKTIILDQPLTQIQVATDPEKSVTRDRIIIEDGIIQHQYKNYYIEWDGSEEEWTLQEETDEYIAFAIQDEHSAGMYYTGQMMSSHFEPGYRSWSNTTNYPIETIWADSTNKILGIQILKSRLADSSIESFKEWLSQNPITIITRRNNTSNKIDSDICLLNTLTNVSYIHTEKNTLSPILTGIYYTGYKGETGDSTICKITPSSQMFKSVDGPNGPFSPDEILLFPEIFNTYFKGWQYSIDSINWESVISGEHGLEIGTFSEKDNTLKISKDSDLYTVEDTTVSFKCLTYNDSVYDIATIAKSYDVIDLSVGGRNFFLKSHMFEDYEIGGGTLNGHWIVNQPEDGIESSKSVEDEGGNNYWYIKANGDVNGQLYWTHGNTIGTYLQDGDQYVFSCEIYGLPLAQGTLPQLPLIQCQSSTGYGVLEGEIGTEENPLRVTYSNVYTKYLKDENGQEILDEETGKPIIDLDFRFDFSGLTGEYYITKLKFEKGKNPTDWTLAPEDTEMTAEIEYCIGTNSSEPPAEDDPSWGSARQYEADLSKGRYLWSRVKNTSTSGIVVYSNYSCLITYQKELYSQETEYLLCDLTDMSQVIATFEDDEESWTTEKPTEPLFQDSVVVASKLWSRIHLKYKTIIDGVVQFIDEYANYTLDTAWEKMLSIESELNSKVAQIFQNTAEGFVHIENGTIAIGNKIDEPSHLILMNHYGIAFMDKSANPGWPTAEDIETFTRENSAWTIDGSLDMNYINVDEIEATYIKNENLILGNHDNRLIDGLNTVDAGDLDIYDKNGHLMFETMTKHLDGSPDNAVWITGFRIHTYDVWKNGENYEDSLWYPDGYIELSCEKGFGEYDINDQLIYGNKNNKWFARISETNKQIISESDTDGVEYGIQMIPMNVTTDDKRIHRGIAFLRINSES